MPLKNPSKKKRLKIPAMSPQDIGTFIDDYCSGRVFTSNECPHKDQLHLVFMPLGLMDFSEYLESDVNNIALIWEYRSAATPRCINGMPTFMSCHLMSKKDWNRMVPLIQAELDRRKMLRAMVTSPPKTNRAEAPFEAPAKASQAAPGSTKSKGAAAGKLGGIR